MNIYLKAMIRIGRSRRLLLLTINVKLCTKILVINIDYFYIVI